MGELGQLGSVLLALCAGCLSPERGPESGVGPHRHVSLLADAPLEVGPEGWTSDWIRAPLPFNELVPSWNVDVPPHASLRVEVRTGSSASPRETPWMDLGGWGEWPRSDRATTDCGMSVLDVDIVRTVNDVHDRMQIRMRTRGLAPGEHLRLHRLDASFSQWWESRTEWRIRPPGERPVVIDVPQRRQTEESPELAPRICSPTSVAMVLEHWGIDLPTEEVAAHVYDAEHDIYGNWNRAVQGAWMLGLSGTFYRFNDWAEAHMFLEEGIPLIISIGVERGALTGAPYESTAGHLLVLCGFDGQGGAIVMDPAVPPGEVGTRTYALDELEPCWLRRGGFAYVLAPAR